MQTVENKLTKIFFVVNYNTLEIEHCTELTDEFKHRYVNIDTIQEQETFSKYYVVIHNNNFSEWLSNCWINGWQAVDCENLYAYKDKYQINWHKLAKNIQRYMKNIGKILPVHVPLI